MTTKQRFEVFKRDNFTCGYCGQKPPAVVLEVDHINPRSKGGSDGIGNLITACKDCNRGKSAILLEDVSDDSPEKLNHLYNDSIPDPFYNIPVCRVCWKEIKTLEAKYKEIKKNWESIAVSYGIGTGFINTADFCKFKDCNIEDITDLMSMALGQVKKGHWPYFIKLCKQELGIE